jgi:hypothetical protein
MACVGPQRHRRKEKEKNLTPLGGVISQKIVETLSCICICLLNMLAFHQIWTNRALLLDRQVTCLSEIERRPRFDGTIGFSDGRSLKSKTILRNYA